MRRRTSGVSLRPYRLWYVEARTRSFFAFAAALTHCGGDMASSALRRA
jgi:hypothetical protein